MKVRDRMKREAAEQNDHEKLEEYKKLRNEIKKDLEKEKQEYYKTKFYNKEASIGSIWSSVNDYLAGHTLTPPLSLAI